jgi:group I intron endonuclease
MFTFDTKTKELPTVACIYKITTLHNEKCYIGSTIDFKKRFLDHRKSLKGNYHASAKLQYSFNKHGEDDIIIEIIKKYDYSIALNSEEYKKMLEDERDAIIANNAYYNTVTDPSDYKKAEWNNKRVYQYDQNGKFIKEWFSHCQIKRETKLQVRWAMNSGRKSGGCYWFDDKISEEEAKKRIEEFKAKNPGSGSAEMVKVSIYNLIGEKIQTFKSYADCWKFLKEKGININRQSVEKYARQTRAVSSEFRLQKGDADFIDQSINKNARINYVVFQYDLEGKFIKAWKTTKDAEKALGLSSIYDNISGKTKKSGNYIFKKEYMAFLGELPEVPKD